MSGIDIAMSEAMRLLPIVNSEKQTLVDDLTADFLGNRKLYLGSGGYVMLGVGSRMLLLHQLILPLQVLTVDHINNDRLDNRKENLRQATASEQQYNQPKKGTWSKKCSQYKGVSWHSSSRKWMAHIKNRSIGYHLYSSLSQEECAFAYDTALRFFCPAAAIFNQIELHDAEKAALISSAVLRKLTLLTKSNSPTVENCNKQQT